MSDHKDNKFWFGFFFGGLLGAIVLFFIGTKEGKKTGKLFKDKGEDIIDDLQDRLEELKKKGKELAEQGEDLKEQIASEIEDKKEVLTEEVSEKLDTALSHIEAIQERGRETTASLRKRLFKNIPKRS